MEQFRNNNWDFPVSSPPSLPTGTDASAGSTSEPAAKLGAFPLAGSSKAGDESLRGDVCVEIELKGNRWNILKAMLRPTRTVTLLFCNAKISVGPLPPSNLLLGPSATHDKKL